MSAVRGTAVQGGDDPESLVEMIALLRTSPSAVLHTRQSAVLDQDVR